MSCFIAKNNVVFLNGVFQVKQIMEEAVTRKFVHEESSSITSLCGKFPFYYDSTVKHFYVTIT